MVISLTKMMVEMGVLETAVKKPAMPTTTKAPGLGDHAGHDLVEDLPHHPAHGPADDHRGAEHAAAAAGADGKGGGQDFADGQGQQKRDGQFVVQGLLGEAVAEGQGLRQKKADDAGAKPPMAGLMWLGIFEPVKDADDAVKGFDVQDTRRPPAPGPAPGRAPVPAGC